MNYYAFTASREPKAAAELREAGFDAFCLMMMDRRRRHRHRAKAPAVWEPRAIVALKGYVFCSEPDLWAVSKLRHVMQPVRFCGKFRPIPDADMARLLSGREYFRDDEAPKMAQRKAVPQLVTGDLVRFGMAAETIEAPVMAVDGHVLLVKLKTMILGRDTMRVPASIVEKVA